MSLPEENTIDATPLFERIDQEKGGAARFARLLHISPQRLGNWRRRGIPASKLTAVAAGLGTTAEDYLASIGKAPPRVAQPMAVYRTVDEEQLMQDYRAGSPTWRLVLRLLARLPENEQEQLASALNLLLTRLGAPTAPSESRAAPSSERFAQRTREQPDKTSSQK
jgi:hypothetical protein